LDSSEHYFARGTLHFHKTRIPCGDQLVICGQSLLQWTIICWNARKKSQVQICQGDENSHVLSQHTHTLCKRLHNPVSQQTVPWSWQLQSKGILKKTSKNTVAGEG
jgi:hypothetical protein